MVKGGGSREVGEGLLWVTLIPSFIVRLQTSNEQRQNLVFPVEIHLHPFDLLTEGHFKLSAAYLSDYDLFHRADTLFKVIHAQLGTILFVPTEDHTHKKKKSKV